MLLIKNGNVYLGRGRYEAGWDILCSEDKIAKVGPGLEAGTGCEVIDAKGKNVYPGLVLGLCGVGAVGFDQRRGSVHDNNEAFDPVSPALDIRYAVDLREINRQRFTRTGITSYGISPGQSPLIAGQISLIHSTAEHTADLFIKERIAVKGNYTAAVKENFNRRKKAPQTRMAMFAQLDEAFRAAKEYSEKKEKDYDEGKEVLCRLLRREIPFVVNAQTRQDIVTVLEIAEKYGLRLVISEAFCADQAADEIMEHGYHVMFGDGDCNLEGVKAGMDPEKLVELYRKGLKLSIGCSGDQGYPPGYEQLWWVASRMMIAGATADEVMDMMTVNPAEALGVDDVTGSIEEGKLADLIICEGNPAQRFDNYIDLTVVAGKVAFEREVK